MTVTIYGSDKDFGFVCTVTLTLGQGHVMWYQLCEILSRSNLTVRSYGQDIFRVYVHCDLDLGDGSLGQGHDTPLGHGR